MKNLLFLMFLGLAACGGDSSKGTSSSSPVTLDGKTNMVDVPPKLVLLVRGDLKWMNPKLAQHEPSSSDARYAEGQQISFSGALQMEDRRRLFCVFHLKELPKFSRGELLKSGEKLQLGPVQVKSYGLVFAVEHQYVDQLIVSKTSVTVEEVEKGCFANILSIKAAL